MLRTNLARKITAGAAAVLFVAAMPACSIKILPRPTATELAGVWVNGETRLTLMSDRTFTLKNAPTYTDPFGDQNWRTESPDTYDLAGNCPVKHSVWFCPQLPEAGQP
ncbi:hypothetical protein [Paenarthrobacter nitroguajacolicus]|uniref:hypothetical protein n=1 Tax=Paenarthrobacter nitroguajacolicus TaxID=211146 RepID=UPI002865FFF4|nr:hypothetical protein [Paenarthrobacter nitroguajacolicus]MDR6637089.1 hypothetical protein [Paenarthrobacter nitroguajacolicus]